MLEFLGEAFALAFAPEVIIFACVGILLGITVGAIPGLSGDMAIAVLLPFVFVLEPASALGLLVGVYKGSMFGGSISAITFGVPGTAGAAATVIDGYQAKLAGKPNKALHTALYSSCIGDTTSDLILIFLALPLALVALKFGPVEFFALYVISLTLVAALTMGQVARGVAAAALGVMLAMIGRDPMTGAQRYTFGMPELSGGIGLIPLLVGIFAISEILVQIARMLQRRRFQQRVTTPAQDAPAYDPSKDKMDWPTFRSTFGATMLGTGMGTFIGALPGAGASLAAFMSYGLAQRLSRKPKEFGKGSLEGVAAAEAGNSATSGATFIPLFAFGIPGSATAALFGAALIMMSITPGPTMMRDNMAIIYALFFILIYANLFNLVASKVLLPVYSRLAMIQPRYVLPIVLGLAILGTFASSNSINAVWMLLAAGVLGVALRWFGVPLGPLVLGFIVGPGLEESLRQALMLGRNDWTHLVKSPLALGIYFGTFALLLLFWLLTRKRNVLTKEEVK
ncbi:tripartite tricarboxylate transporter permease [Roseinatronobacter bogoriensis]|uniref:DUF112 domain-containing protein n=1 Tax=Roseinatronobacter bogoriensis subsp. barguzinensis TaxID=441209 RepID=A0A2K8K517_9RHOB|nr:MULTISPECIES: tripartite tricarboxylate transporter permease [Rhodobaca]ATX64519.1 hypothetical protein BG454_00615 [Rhodobaca barguzinensis]MBB4209234.1 putative tricarboxylic transport membrane protein [Rhodobaca bogoriensis DSM 18756]TDW36240.1 putative tricarboxylic transport membrane protein [Rhodobaca barguzinensis]TDY67632.1 putative tricarboxylic transport membrane protein [Rhodobaca bogoriensis DSM 18756]